jgi:hypothetical protein
MARSFRCAPFPIIKKTFLREKIMVKMIIMDLDGTLLMSDKNISNYTLSILEKCKKMT